MTYTISTLLTYNIQHIIYCSKYHYDIDIIIKYIRYRKVIMIALAMNCKLQTCNAVLVYTMETLYSVDEIKTIEMILLQ
jgi:hypothetical protein